MNEELREELKRLMAMARELEEAIRPNARIHGEEWVLASAVADDLAALYWNITLSMLEKVVAKT